MAGHIRASSNYLSPGMAWLEATRTSELGLLNTLLYFALLAWLFGLYLLVLKKLFALGNFSEAHAHPALKIILAFTGASLLVLLFVRGRFSTDIFNYIWYGRIFVYLTVGALWFWPWYVSLLIALAVLIGPGRLWNATRVLCASSMTLYALFPVAAEPLAALVGWTGLVIMLPPITYMLFSRKPLSDMMASE
ncbi:MAG TPA: hypothetical protein VJ183_19905 [Chloroflexia bacterium]|nr:hypothetical protein [Chloroflexia bacterium]